MNWWLAAGSLAAVLALVGLAWALGFGRENVGTEEDAADLLAELLPDFEPSSIWVSHDWKTALALGGQRLAILRSQSARFVALNLPQSALSRTGPDDFLVETGDRAWGKVRIDLPFGRGDELQSALDSLADNDVSRVRA